MSSEKARQKQVATRFKKGQSGNPAGKPKGTRNATTRMLEALLAGEAEEITRKAIEMAKAGHLPAIRELFDRLFGKPVAAVEWSDPSEPVQVVVIEEFDLDGAFALAIAKMNLGAE